MFRMTSKSYQDAIQLLNTLQSNASTIEMLKKNKKFLNQQSLPEMKDYLHRLGYTVSDLNRLNIIHISGTKGKGSTAAFCNSILSQKLKVGLYTSPHIKHVRERIQIGGHSLSKESFTQYFFQVWDALESSTPSEPTYPMKPMYFRYLTLLCFHVFIQEKVDAVVLEVGMGGEYDATNVIQEPLVCGITSLGLDHTSVLGETIESIAWHKAGIAKPNVPLISVPQPPSALGVIHERSKERNVSKIMDLSSCQVKEMSKYRLGLDGEHQKVNACLAKELVTLFAEEYTKKRNVKLEFSLQDIKKGLSDARWPGRAQIYKENDTRSWFLDGAHTKESLEFCSRWFELTAPRSSKYLYLDF